MVELHIIDADTPRAEVIEALGHINREAKRVPHVRGTDDYPSRWDRLHRTIDELLGMLDEVEA